MDKKCTSAHNKLLQGCILYFMLTGHPPFDGSPSEKLVKHQVATPPSLSEKRPNAPAELLQISEKMLSKSPQDRYQSAADLLAALRGL
ncbi:MAG: hypothetical protein AAF961_05355 [Planctomycetota bacterium]